jgi:hypothetical protein
VHGAVYQAVIITILCRVSNSDDTAGYQAEIRKILCRVSSSDNNNTVQGIKQ